MGRSARRRRVARTRVMMQFCGPHWSELEEMIVSKGMGALITPMPEDASTRPMDEWVDLEVYDPLLDAFYDLTNMSLQRLGLYLLEPRPGGGRYCPMCEVEEHGCNLNTPGAAKSWMEGCSDDVLIRCRRQRLLPAPH